MKKVFAVVILLAITLSLFTGCQEPYDPNKLYTDWPSEDTFLKMYIALSHKDIFVDMRNYLERPRISSWYYGTINGYIVVGKNTSDLAVCGRICVADYVFTDGCVFNIYVYKDDTECGSLQEAYENGWLTKEHIGKIHERHPEALEERWRLLEEYRQSQKESQGN